MPSQFHEATLNELRLGYLPDPASLNALDDRARDLGMPFPASFVEWYGMRDGIGLLRRHSNGDEPVAPAKLGSSSWSFENKGDSGSLHDGVLTFMVENQGVCVWGIRLGAGDDPPVLVAVDPKFEWRPHAETFSTFIACQVWDHAEPSERVLLAAQASPLASVDLDLLRRSFRERPTTHGWPGKNNFRFERDDARVIIWDCDGQADWWLSARSETGVAALARELWMCGDLRTSLYGVEEPGERALAKIRRSDG